MSARPLLRDRYSFGDLEKVLELPDLIAVQHESFNWLMESGLKGIFSDISPITDVSETLSLELEFDPKVSAIKYTFQKGTNDNKLGK